MTHIKNPEAFDFLIFSGGIKMENWKDVGSQKPLEGSKAQKQYAANIDLFKVNNRNFEKKLWNMFNVTNKNTKIVSITSPLVFVFLTFNIFHTFL